MPLGNQTCTSRGERFTSLGFGGGVPKPLNNIIPKLLNNIVPVEDSYQSHNAPYGLGFLLKLFHFGPLVQPRM